jgi:hypothetical protein
METAAMVLFMVVLYYVTYPGTFITLPNNNTSSKNHDMAVKITHALVFSIIFIVASPYIHPLFKKNIF